MQLHTITRIDKSQLASITFGKNYNSEEGSLSVLRYNLQRALRLGNLYKNHVRIQFYNESGHYMETEATIWAVTEKYVMIKGGTVIPIDSIVDVTL